MPNNETKKNLTVKSASSRKAQGTRTGTLLDWREGSVKTGNKRHGDTIRDGR
jgi:hypothetical protein